MRIHFSVLTFDDRVTSVLQGTFRPELLAEIARRYGLRGRKGLSV